jgi:predicted RNA methylase
MSYSPTHRDALRALYRLPMRATRTGPLFGAFPYPTKISPEAIAIFIATHTEPGATVFDGFAGSGTTGIAAKLCERPTEPMQREAVRLGLRCQWGPRHAVLYELSTVGALVSRTLTKPPEPQRFQEAAEALLQSAETDVGNLYAARSPDGRPGTIRYTIWSDVLLCPACRQPSLLWDGCVSRRPARISDRFTCPECATTTPLDQVERCTELQPDLLLGGSRALRRREPVWLYGISAGKHWSRAVTVDDRKLIANLQQASIPPAVPQIAIPWGDLYRSGYHVGISHLHHFYTARNLLVFANLWARTWAFANPLGEALRFWLLSYNAAHATIMTRVVAKTGYDDLVVTSAQPGVLYVSGLPVEKNLFSGLRRKLKTIAAAFGIMHPLVGRVEVRQQSSCSVDLADNTVDYVFTDPPFGGNIPYAEINFINEAWLGSYTDRTDEAIISPAQNKSLQDYRRLLGSGLTEARRVLKDEGQATIVFHSSTATVWNALQSAYTDAGFSVCRTSILDKTQGSFKQVTTTGAVKGDPILLLEKSAKTSGISATDVWRVADELRQSAIHAADPLERTAERLYSRLVAHFLKHNQPVPLDADTFYRWHARVMDEVVPRVHHAEP